MELIMRFILLFLLGIIGCNNLPASLEDHLKPISDKSGKHRMRNIDFIYMINLDERPEKFASSIAQLHPYGINPYRFSAINGWQLPISVINDIGVVCTQSMVSNLKATWYSEETNGPTHGVIDKVGRTYFCHCMSKGAIAIVLSHLSILEDALKSHYKTIWVMEDDIQVMRDPHCLSTLIDSLDRLVGKDKWDVLFTDPDTKNNNGQYVPCKGAGKRPNFTPAKPGRFSQHTSISDCKKIT
jgi:hypothetical protein